MTDTVTSPERADSTSPFRTGAELLLGLSFVTAVAFGGYGAAVQQTSVVAELAAVVFVTTLMCVLVSWFTGAGDAESGQAAD